MNLWVTLWPSFAHFPKFAHRPSIEGIRLNSAMVSASVLDKEIETIQNVSPAVPLWFDVKARQLRVTEILPNEEYLDIHLNHSVAVKTPTEVLFKAGEDAALLEEISEDGYRLTFCRNPHYSVKPGESLHIRHPSLKVGGPIFTDAEIQKIEKMKAFGMKRWFISYVEDSEEVDLFQELVGKDSEIILKIESKPGLKYVAEKWRKQENLSLAAACGDLFVEVDRPHDILKAVEFILEKDSEALAGSRILLSVHEHPTHEPSFADFCQLDWLRRLGYKRAMLCDAMCLSGEELSIACNVFDETKKDVNGTRNFW